EFAAVSGAGTVHASGEGRVSAAPDVARLIVGVQVQDPAVARANADATARMKKVLAALEKTGVAAKDIRTVRYNVDVQRSYQGPNAGAVIGYSVVNQVQVTVRELPRLGTVLEQAVAAG